MTNYSTSIHESGHIIMAILLGLPWKTATVSPIVIEGRTALGQVRFLKPDNSDDLIRVLLGGYAAEKIAGLPISYGSRVEYKECVELAESIDPDPDRWTEALLWQTTEKIRTNKSELETLASYLQWMGTITPAIADLVKNEIPILN